MRELLERFAGLKILVVGDPMWDVYHWGHVDRMSPEAPVPVFVQDRTEERLGGAANVRHQLEALGVQVASGWGPRVVWTRKMRYMVGSHQLLRADIDLTVPNTLPALQDFNVVVISDYDKGACTEQICRSAIETASALNIPVIVDPKCSTWSKYAGCTVICPNHLELLNHEGAIPAQFMLEKRGPHGLRLHDLKGHSMDYPAQARHVFDVTGAGDTVTAVFAACMAAQISLPDACRLANVAAGYVVGEIGTAVCPLERLTELCASV